jgi:hypothetical protein
MRPKKLISIQNGPRRVAFSAVCGHNGATFVFTKDFRSLEDFGSRLGQAEEPYCNRLVASVSGGPRRAAAVSRLPASSVRERREAARNSVARPIRSDGACEAMHWIVILLQILAVRWRACCKTGRLAWAPAPAEGLRVGAWAGGRPIGRARFQRAQSGWMTFLPAKEGFGGPPDYHGCSAPSVVLARRCGGPGTARSLLVSSPPTSLLRPLARRLTRRRLD